MVASRQSDQRFERARRFLSKRKEKNERRLISGDLDGICQAVVIPVLAEERNLFDTFASLEQNPVSGLERTLVICVVNNRAEPFAPADQIAENQRILGHLDSLIQGRSPNSEPRMNSRGLRLAYVDASSKGAEIGPKMGVGEARRIGLDLGLEVLTTNAEEQGLLISLDADTIVEADYLFQIRKHFAECDSSAAVVGYAHPMPAEALQRTAIIRYELFLRYHEIGLHLAKSPYAFPTIGSTIIVSCDAYVAAGGMNRRQAGEDFYFLQQLAKTGKVGRVDTTCVYPSPRTSERVPFGTGASIGQHLSGENDRSTVYHPRSYRILGDWLALVNTNPEKNSQALLLGAEEIFPRLKEFLEYNRFAELWPRIQKNAPHNEALVAQFHRWFDGFKTLKLMHYLRDHELPQFPIFEAIQEVLDRSGFDDFGLFGTDLCKNIEAQEDLLGILRRNCADPNC